MCQEERKTTQRREDFQNVQEGYPEKAGNSWAEAWGLAAAAVLGLCMSLVTVLSVVGQGVWTGVRDEEEETRKERWDRRRDRSSKRPTGSPSV